MRFLSIEVNAEQLKKLAQSWVVAEKLLGRKSKKWKREYVTSLRNSVYYCRNGLYFRTLKDIEISI